MSLGSAAVHSRGSPAVPACRLERRRLATYRAETHGEDRREGNMFRRKKTTTTRRQMAQEGSVDTEEVANEAESDDTPKPSTIHERWERDDAAGGAFTIVKKDGRRFKA